MSRRIFSRTRTLEKLSGSESMESALRSACLDVDTPALIAALSASGAIKEDALQIFNNFPNLALLIGAMRAARGGSIPSELNFSNQRMQHAGASLLFHALRLQKGITKLNLHNIEISPDIEAIGDCLRAHSDSLTVLDLSDNSFNGITSRNLFLAIPSLKALQSLNIANTGLGSAQELIECLKQVSSTLKEIDVSHNRFGDDLPQGLSAAYEENAQLSLTSWSCRGLTFSPPQGWPSFAAFLLHPNCAGHLKQLHMGSCKGCPAEQLVPIIQALSQCRELEVLDLSSVLEAGGSNSSSNNENGNHLGMALTAMLKECGKLETLKLNGNGQGDRLVEGLIAGLSQASNLHRLEMNHTKVSADGMKLLGETLRVRGGQGGVKVLHCSNSPCLNLLGQGNSSLEEVDFSFGSIGMQDCPVLGEAIASSVVSSLKLDGIRLISSSLSKLLTPISTAAPQHLQHLSLFNCSLGDGGAVALAPFLSSLKLQSLNLKFNRIADRGLKSLVEGLQSQSSPPSLLSLNLSNNTIKDSGAESLAAWILASNCALAECRLANNTVGEKGLVAILGTAACEHLHYLDISANEKLWDDGVEHCAKVLAAALGQRSASSQIQIHLSQLGGSALTQPVECANIVGDFLQCHICSWLHAGELLEWFTLQQQGMRGEGALSLSAWKQTWGEGMPLWLCDKSLAARGIYYQHLNAGITIDRLKDLMEDAGEVVDVSMPLDALTSLPKGCGWVLFASEEGASKAHVYGRKGHWLPGGQPLAISRLMVPDLADGDLLPSPDRIEEDMMGRKRAQAAALAAAAEAAAEVNDLSEQRAKAREGKTYYEDGRIS